MRRSAMPAAAPPSMMTKTATEIASAVNFDPQALRRAALTAMAACLDGGVVAQANDRVRRRCPRGGHSAASAALPALGSGAEAISFEREVISSCESLIAISTSPGLVRTDICLA